MTGVAPALSTSTVGRTRRSTDAASSGSAASPAMTAAPVAASSSRSCAAVRATTVTSAPRATNASTTPRPSPRLPPVTTARCFSRVCMVRSSLLQVGAPGAGRDQALQAAADVSAPGVSADVEAFVVGNQTDVGEMELRPVALLRDLEDDVGALPLGLVLDEVELVV